MKKIERITAKIEANKELIKKLSCKSYYGPNRFIRDAQEYIKATKEGRMINSIGSVSASGTSRTIKFLSCEKYDQSSYLKYGYKNYFTFFEALGYTPAANKSHYFRISGCGMDMIFHTNYTIIHRLQRLGFISKKQCEKLAQMTPTTI